MMTIIFGEQLVSEPQSEYDKHNVTFILTIDAISLAIHCTHNNVRLFVTLMQNEVNLFLKENNDNFLKNFYINIAAVHSRLLRMHQQTI